MRLKPADEAKAFQRKDIFGGSVSLEGFRGRRLLLSFYRYAACPLCNLRIHELSGLAPKWKEKGLEMVAIFESPVESIKQYVTGRHDIPYTIIADPDRELYKLYGVEGSWTGFMKSMVTRSGDGMRSIIGKGFLPGKLEGDVSMLPADFLVGPDLTIKEAYYGADIGDHIPIERIEAFIKDRGVA